MSRSSALSSKDSKKTKDKSKTPTKSADLNVEDNFDSGFKVSQSMFLSELKSGIDELSHPVFSREKVNENSNQPF